MAGSGGATGGVTGSGVAGSGGTTGSGGVTGAAGDAGSGGATGAGATAGSTATGGTPGAGGSISTGGDGGGAAGSGGDGGVTGSGGSAGNGGRGGAAGNGGRGGSAGNGGRGGSTGGGGSGGGMSGGTGGTAPACTPGTKPSGGRMVCTNMRASAGGTYTYELWADGTGTGCMTVYNMDAKFSASWSGVKDLLARVGLSFDSTRTHTQIGTITADFNETKTGGSDGFVYVGIYGWTVEPLKEFYIIDDWGAVKPAGVAPDGTPRTSVGTLTADGEIYDVWKRTRENKPNITGTDQTFEQYFSIRRTARQCGRISVSTHLNEWTRLGLQLGKMYEAMLLVEAQNTTGTIDFTTATVVAR